MAHSLISATRSRPFTVLVEGNIGSGKTTYLEHFRQFEDITLLTEPVEAWRNLSGWNLLDLMYKNPEKWAMPFQSYVSLTMLLMHTKEIPTKIKLMERSIFSARYCFVENMIQNKTMHPAMSSVLDQWFNYILTATDIPVDLIVYLKTTPSIVHERIRKRARSEEQCVPLAYIEQLHELHEDWLVRGKSFRRPAPVLILDADLDLTHISEEYKRSEHKILQNAVEVVINSPTKSPKRSNSATISTPTKSAKVKFNL
ncbi:deoxynucleoside kinase-like isoform X2 [Arctopsyche grandis]